MVKYIGKRLFYGFLVILGVVTLVFFLFNILPGDPARMMLGQRADEESVEIIKHDLGLDRPIGIQYLAYLNDLAPISLHNNFDSSSYWYLESEKYAPCTTLLTIGSTSVVLKMPYLRRSYQTKRKVSEIIATAFPQTAVLALTAMTFALILGILLGIFSALHKGTWIDHLTLLLSSIGMSLPSFFAAILIAWFFAYVLADWTHLNMFGNLYSVDDYGCGEYINLRNLILPALTLGIRPLAVLVELTKSSMLEALSQDYIRTAKAKGVSGSKIIFGHALKNSLIPVITYFGPMLAYIVTGSLVVEQIFAVPGIGRAFVSSITNRDYPMVMGTTIVLAVLIVVMNLVSDILYKVVDPRINLE